MPNIAVQRLRICSIKATPASCFGLELVLCHDPHLAFSVEPRITARSCRGRWPLRGTVLLTARAAMSAHEVRVDDLDVAFPGERPNFLPEGYGDPQALKQAIGALPDGQRTAITLLKLQGLSLKEAASASGASVGALKVATHRAMSALRKRLKA